ncbi:LuxR C-terminal-related transcriptional regulator [Marinobacter daepoensis]|nr:LuxR C-terminal-related transcriptional regulator [Marinobacter daepoensis]MBY6033144.1 LuxR C-terminal-related transcriptional regulator [Marinobacter daepoensis]
MKITSREKDVFKLLIQGKTNKQIAAQLNISDFTVRDHVSALLRKRNASSRLELIAAYHVELGEKG